MLKCIFDTHARRANRPASSPGESVYIPRQNDANVNIINIHGFSYNDTKPHPPRQVVGILISPSSGEASSATLLPRAGVCAPPLCSPHHPLSAVRLRAASDGLRGLNLPQTSGQLGFAGLQQSRRPRTVPAQDLRHRRDPSAHYHLDTHGRGCVSNTVTATLFLDMQPNQTAFSVEAITPKWKLTVPL